MFYLLGDQNFYFPSSDDQSYLLKTFLQNRSRQEYQLPTIVKVKSLNVPHGPLKSLLAKNMPILLLEIDQLHSILAEYHQHSHDRKDHTHRYRLKLPQGKIAKKLLPKKRFSQPSLITFTHAYESHEHSDDDYDNTRTIVRTLNEVRASSSTLCRIPLNYPGYFELLNENDQSMEPYHHLSDLLKDEEIDNSLTSPKTDKIPQSFFLRSTCLAYTKRSVADERKQSGSGDSCYGSLSDLESQKNLLCLNDYPMVLQPGQIITIRSQCSAYRRRNSQRNSHEDQYFSSSSSATAWLRQKSRLIFQKRKSAPMFANENTQLNKHSTKFNQDSCNRSERMLECQTEQGEIVYIPVDTSGLFSPLRSTNSPSLQSSTPNECLNISGVFQLNYLLNHLRFPISVRLLDNSLFFENIFLPAMIQQQEITQGLSTKFRLLLPYTEQVVYACPLIISSCFKTHPIIIPIPINADMEVQRCLNMREICQNRMYHDLVYLCSRRLHRYRTHFSLIHFPVVLNPSALLNCKRKTTLFRKRAQSESHLEQISWDFSPENHRRSCEMLYQPSRPKLDEKSMLNTEPDTMLHRDSFQTLKEKFANHFTDQSRHQTARRSAHYSKFKTDQPRKSSQEQQLNSDDENYREVDHIYDYIRSGDLTDDVKRIQAKEQAFNEASRQRTPKMQVRHSKMIDAINQAREKSAKAPKIYDSPASSHTRRFPHYLDDSRPLDSEVEDDVEDGPLIDCHILPADRNGEMNGEAITIQPIMKSQRMN